MFISSMLIYFSVQAEIYKWTDSEGSVHFTDKPPAEQKTEIIKLKINTYKNVEISKNYSVKAHTKVLLYSTSWCGVCKKAKNYFRSNNIPFIEYDVEKSSKGIKDYNAMGAKAVPIILIGQQRMNGFSVKSFQRMYENKVSNPTDF